MPSWEFYAAAAEDIVPLYRVELARSNRSSCCQTGSAKHCMDPSIDKGEVRIGSLDSESGSYGRWIHLKCWRVPAKVWLGLPDPAKCQDVKRFEAALVGMSAVLICGIGELPSAERRAVAHLCMNRDNWAKLTKRTDPRAVAALLAGDAPVRAAPGGGGAPPPGGAITASAGGGRAGGSTSTSTALEARAAQRERFVVPIPGRDGAKVGSLAERTFCMTGIFPELGGGAGLALGKERAQALIESFGGRVTTCLSGRTDYLLVGARCPCFVRRAWRRALLLTCPRPSPLAPRPRPHVRPPSRHRPRPPCAAQARSPGVSRWRRHGSAGSGWWASKSSAAAWRAASFSHLRRRRRS